MTLCSTLHSNAQKQSPLEPCSSLVSSAHPRDVWEQLKQWGEGFSSSTVSQHCTLLYRALKHLTNLQSNSRWWIFPPIEPYEMVLHRCTYEFSHNLNVSLSHIIWHYQNVLWFLLWFTSPFFFLQLKTLKGKMSQIFSSAKPLCGIGQVTW